MLLTFLPVALVAATAVACVRGWNYPLFILTMVASLAAAGVWALSRDRGLRTADRVGIAASSALALALAIVLLFDLLNLRVGPVPDATGGVIVGTVAGFVLFHSAVRSEPGYSPDSLAWSVVVAAVVAFIVSDDVLYELLRVSPAPEILRALVVPTSVVIALLVLLAGLHHTERRAASSASLILVAPIGFGLYVLGESGAQHSDFAITLGALAGVLICAAWTLRQFRRSSLPDAGAWATAAGTFAFIASLTVVPAVVVLAPILIGLILCYSCVLLYRRVVGHVWRNESWTVRRSPISPSRLLLAMALSGQLLLSGWVWFAVRTDLSAAQVLVALEEHTGLWEFSDSDVALALMRDQYLWFEELSGDDARSAESASAVIKTLRRDRDRWSAVEPRVHLNLPDKNERFGTGLSVRREGRDLVVTYVHRDSPAHVAGVRRGFRLLEINDQPLLDKSEEEASLMLDGPGPKRAVYRTPDNVRREIVLRRAWFPIGVVRLWRSFALDGHRVGYVVLEEFTSEGVREFRHAIAGLRAQGVEELILDLRYNPGGQWTAAVDVASLIVGKEADGKVLVRSVHNRRYRDRDRDGLLKPDPEGLDLRRLFVITAGKTCSASELLVNGLRPYLEVITIGSTTCGKPYGVTRVPYRSLALLAVTFEVVNSKGEGTYAAGLTPTCEAMDDSVHELGDPREASLRTALHFARHGRCPVSEGLHDVSRVPQI